MTYWNKNSQMPRFFYTNRCIYFFDIVCNFIVWWLATLPPLLRARGVFISPVLVPVPSLISFITLPKAKHFFCPCRSLLLFIAIKKMTWNVTEAIANVKNEQYLFNGPIQDPHAIYRLIYLRRELLSLRFCIHIILQLRNRN